MFNLQSGYHGFTNLTHNVNNHSSLLVNLALVHISLHVCAPSRLNCVFVIPWTVACQAPLSTEFSRQEYWSGLPLPPFQGIFPTQGSNPGLLRCRWILYLLSHQRWERIHIIFKPASDCSESGHLCQVSTFGSWGLQLQVPKSRAPAGLWNRRTIQRDVKKTLKRIFFPPKIRSGCF